MEGSTATSQQTIEALLKASRREGLPLANSFAQRRTGNDMPSPGPLSEFVRARRERALQQYLLVHATVSAASTEHGAPPWSVARDSRVWARAMSLDPGKGSSRSAISKNWAWLEQAGLVARTRRGRLSQITLLRDDGTGEPYCEHPGERGEAYFKLPYVFWRAEWHRRLDLATTAVLLIALSLNEGFVLPGSHVHAWYGISPTTLTKGLTGLRRAGLLRTAQQRKAAPLAPEGYTWEHRYTLLPPFERKASERRQGRRS